MITDCLLFDMLGEYVSVLLPMGDCLASPQPFARVAESLNKLLISTCEALALCLKEIPISPHYAKKLMPCAMPNLTNLQGETL